MIANGWRKVALLVYPLPQPLPELGITPAAQVILDGHRQGLLLAHQHHQLFDSGDAGVLQISLQHRVVLCDHQQLNQALPAGGAKAQHLGGC